VCICYQVCTALVGPAVEDDVQRSQEQFTAQASPQMAGMIRLNEF